MQTRKPKRALTTLTYKIPPKQPYNLHPRGPHIKNLLAKALKATNGQCVIIIRKSDKAKFTVNMLV